MNASPAPIVAPGPRGLPWLGNGLDVLMGDPLRGLLERHRTYGEVVRTRVGWNEVFLVNDPDGVRHVLQHNHKNYRKGPSYALLELVVGKGLLTSEGPEWLRNRKLVQPAFHREQLVRFGEVVARHTGELVAAWQRTERGTPVDVSAAMMRLTFRIVGEALFSDDVGDEAGEVAEAVSTALTLFDRFVGLALLLPPGTPLPRRLPLLGVRRVIDRLDRLVLDLVDRRRRSGRSGDDLLGMLMAARDEEGSSLSDAQVKDEVMTLILAGHETTANALSWAYAMLGENPDVEARLEAEADALDGQPPGIADLPRLPYTERVVSETMRLYPPAWIVVRRAIEADVVAGFRIPAGSSVQISPWTLHRHPAHWREPDRFDPDRFSPEQSAGRSPWVYLPFGGGPRVCIGKAFALLEARLVLATLAQQLRVRPVPGHPIEPHATVTLRPRHGILATLVPRHG